MIDASLTPARIQAPGSANDRETPGCGPFVVRDAGAVCFRAAPLAAVHVAHMAGGDHGTHAGNADPVADPALTMDPWVEAGAARERDRHQETGPEQLSLRARLLHGAAWGVVVSVFAIAILAQVDGHTGTLWRLGLTVICVAACAVTAAVSGRRVSSRR